MSMDGSLHRPSEGCNIGITATATAEPYPPAFDGLTEAKVEVAYHFRHLLDAARHLADCYRRRP